MTPILVSAPETQPVTLAEVKGHLRVDHGDEDERIIGLIAFAVGYLDGWTGVLGRCIMPQSWKVVVEAGGAYTLPMPDVVEASADYGDGPVQLSLTPSPLGSLVDVEDACEITFNCAMPSRLVDVVKVAIMLLVERDYDRPSGPEYDALMRSVDGAVTAIRWRHA